jgi:Uma2 family endonuclease
MRVVMLEAPPEVEKMLADRRRSGLDVRDEMWDGVLHRVPPPGGPRQRLNTRLNARLFDQAERRGLVPHVEGGLFRGPGNYRVPDQLFCRPDQVSDRGAEGAELVIEIRSKDDETYQKIDFYSACGVREMMVLHPEELRVELFRAIGGRLVPVQPGPDGEHTSEVLGITLRTVDGKLEITWDGGSATV